MTDFLDAAVKEVIQEMKEEYDAIKAWQVVSAWKMGLAAIASENEFIEQAARTLLQSGELDPLKEKHDVFAIALGFVLGYAGNRIAEYLIGVNDDKS